MADAFAPQLGQEVRFNQPVETPSGLGALAKLGSFFIDNFADTKEDQKSAAPKVDTNLATFRAGLERVEAIRQERGEAAAQVAERQLASNFAMAGINLDKSYEDVYKTTTGRPWAGYGMDVEATMLQETLKDQQVQANYIASFAVLGPDATDDQRIEYAIGQKATLQAAENEIARSKAEANYQWSVQTEAAYASEIDTFLNTSLGALAVNAQQGGRVSPMDVQNIKAQWSIFKASYSRPTNISDDQWKSTQDKITNIDNLLTTFEKAASSEVLLEEVTVAISNAIMQGKEGDLQAMVAGAAAAKDITTFADLAGVNFATTLMDAGKSLNLNVTQQNWFGHILNDQDSLTDVGDPNSFLSSIPDTVKTNIDGKTPEQIFNGLDASGKLASLVKPADLNRPDAKEQFVTNAATIGAVLMNNPSEEFLSDSFLKQLVANSGFIRNVLALDAIDPEGATVARQYVRSGLNVERGRQATNFGTIEAYLEGVGIVWNGSAYALTPEAEAASAQDTSISGVSPLQIYGNVIKQANDRRAAIVTIDRALKALEVPTETTTQAGGAGGGSTSTATPIGAALGIDFSTIEAENGLPQGFLERTAFIESRGNPNAQNPNSSAGGLFQFIDSTARQYGVRDRFDPVQATDGAVDLAVDNMRILTRALGRKPTAAELYLAHQQGGEGARRLLSNPNAKAADIVGIEAVRLNGGSPDMTAGEFASLWLDKFNNTKTTAPTAGRPSDANAVASRAGEAVQRAVTTPAGTPSAPMTMASGGAPTTPMEAATAELPENIPADTAAGGQEVSQLSAAIAVDPDVQAFIQEIAGDPDKSYASDAEFLAAQERGELEPGDTVVVNGDVYVIRKNGTARRLGTANA